MAYSGKTTFTGEMAQRPLGEAAVLTLTESVSENSVIYLDRFFTGLCVLGALSEKGIKMTGTIQRNRLPRAVRDKILPETAERGQWRLLANCDETMALTCWKDSRVVLVLSSFHGIQPSPTCKRWVKRHKHKKTFPQPESISKYNTNMGGLDLMDRMLGISDSEMDSSSYSAFHHGCNSEHLVPVVQRIQFFRSCSFAS